MSIHRAANCISGRHCTAHAKIEGVIHELSMIKTFESTVEKSDTEVNTLHNNWTQHKGGVLSGSLSMTVYFGTPIFHRMMQDFATSGIDSYFDLTIVNNDAGSEAGAQTVVYHDCNLTSIQPSKMDVDSDALEEDYELTFSGMDYITNFVDNTI